MVIDWSFSDLEPLQMKLLGGAFAVVVEKKEEGVDALLAAAVGSRISASSPSEKSF